MSNVFGVLKDLKGLVFSKPDSTDVINWTFRLHRFTAVILITCSILVSCKQFLGENIHCMLDGLEDAGDKKLIESFCFMKATFTLSRTEGASPLDTHHGVGHGNHRSDENNEFHNYYQWVCFVLFLQGVFFYFPYIAWKNMEKGKLKKMLINIPGIGAKADHGITDQPLDEQVTKLAKYLYENKDYYNGYARKFLLCEVGNLINILLQIYLMDVFLGGKFVDYGKSFFADTSDQFNLSMESVFPKVTKCTMPNFGASGKVVYHSGICTLPVNILSEKIYMFLFVWMIILAIVSILHCIIQFFIMLSPRLRKVSIASQMFLFGYGCRLSDPTTEKVIMNSSYGIFVIVRQLSKNLEPPQFQTLLATLGNYFEPSYYLPVPFPSSTKTTSTNPSDCSNFSKITKGNIILRV